MSEDPLIGRVLPSQIEILNKIGEGGMGAVYEGYQSHLGRRVAIKVMTPEHVENPVALDYFLREARSASKLRHPNIIQIIDFGTHEGLTYMVMEFIPGKPLSDLIEEEFPFTPLRVANIIDQALSALTVAHENKIVHRDLKPDNFMVEQLDRGDFVKVLDFGIAQSKASNSAAGPLTQQGAVVGTPQYMSPEQAMGEHVDARSDLFSLGIILYQLISGEVPFRGKNLPEVLIKVIQHQPPPPSVLRPDLEIDPLLEMICLRAIKKDPDVRYQNAQEFRDALLPVLNPGANISRPVNAPNTFIFKKKKSGKKPKPKISTLAQVSETPATIIAHLDQKSEANTDSPWKQEFALGISLSEIEGDLIGERRQVVALVIHQRVIEHYSAEKLSNLIGGIESVIGTICEKWGGVFQGRQGAFSTLLFGLPAPRSDDAFRSIQATLQLRLALRKTAPKGVHFGYSLAHGEIFCPSNEISRAAGHPIDLASETVRGAGDDDIRVSGARFQEALSTMFRLSQANADGSMGIIGLLNAVEEIESQEISDLIGRDSEVATLLGLLGRVVRGEGNLCLISAESGYGKTALLNQTFSLAQQRDLVVLRGHFRFSEAVGTKDIIRQLVLDYVRQKASSGVEPLSIFQQVGVAYEYARVLASIVNDDLQEAFGFVGSADAIPMDMNGTKIIDVAFRALLKALSAQKGVAILIDGLNALDERYTLINAWSEFATKERVLFVVCVKEKIGEKVDPPPGITSIRLKPMKEASARAFLRSKLKGQAKPNLIEKLIRIAKGVPLYLNALSESTIKNKTFSLDEALSWLAKTTSVSDILIQRLFDQDKPGRNILALMSTMGDDAKLSHVLALSSSNWEPEETLQELHKSGMIVIHDELDDPVIRFSSPAFREVIYDQLSTSAKTKIHSKVAIFYNELVEVAGENAHHDDLYFLMRHLVSSERPKTGYTFLLRLIDLTLVSCEYQPAIDHINFALKLIETKKVDTLDAAIRLSLKKIRALEASGHHRTALKNIRGLERSEGIEDRTKLEIKVEMVRLWLVEEDPDLVEKIAKKALHDARENVERTKAAKDYILLIRIIFLVAEIVEKQGKMTRAAQFAIEAVSIAESRSISSKDNGWGPEIIWGPLNLLGRIRIRGGQFKAAKKLFELAIKVIEETGDRRGELAVRGNMASLFSAEDKIDGAMRAIRKALVIAREISDLHNISKLEHNRGLILMRQRRMELAKEAFHSSLELAEELDWREGIAMNAVKIDGLARKQVGSFFSRE